MQNFDMGRVPPIYFGNGRLSDLPAVIDTVATGPVLIVADAILADLGMTDRVANDLKSAGIPNRIAAEVVGEPKETLVDALADQARGMQAAAVVGLGGGAAMDAAKLVAAIAPADRPAAHYALSAHPLPENGLPAIAIPTTAGTGSEVTRTAIVSTPSGIKNWFWCERLMFDCAILDPELTVSLPAHLTAWTGIDAVAHALESSTALTTSPAGQLYGLQALRILSEFLPQAVANGHDLVARGQVLWGSTVAGLALHNCNTHMGHNVSHALGSLARIHHGLATGLALEVALPWLVARPEGAQNYALAAQALGGPAEAAALPGAFAALMRACKIDACLPEICSGVSATELASAMKSDANFGMSQNAACPISFDDLDGFAASVLALPRAVAA